MSEGKKKILIVDDEPEMVEELAFLLKKENYLVVGAFDGRQAIKRFKKEYFDLVLLDIKMPKVSGLEVFREMKNIHFKVPVIIITGSFAKNRANQAVQEGVEDVLYKPFDIDELLKKIKKYI